MKTRARRQLLSGFFFGVLALGVFESGYAQEGDYYIVDGQRITLTPSETYEAVEVRPGRQSAFRSAAERSPDVAVEPAPILQRFDVVLLRKKPATTRGAFSNSIRALNRNTAVESSVPVYNLGGVDQVLVNEFLVQFKPNVERPAAESFLRDKGAEVVTPPEKIANRYTIRFPDKSARDALKVVNDIADDEPVQFAEPNFIRLMPERPRTGPPAASETPGPQSQPGPNSAASSVPSTSPGPLAPITPNDPIFSNQWALDNKGMPGVAGADIGAREAWDINKGSNQITIAIIDEGVDVNHPDLKDKIVTPYDATDQDNNQQPNDWDGHGTACAGIASAITDNALGVAGVSWGARVLPVRIAFSNYQHGPWITSNAIIEDGIRAAVDRGAHVLSNSWGGGSPSSVINSAIDYAISKNRIVVIAAGNDSGPVSYPANLSTSRTLITVSATNEWDEFKTMASRDGESWWGSNFGPEVNISAPGVHVQTTDIAGAAGYASSDYVATFNGTSSATPFVAGAAAVLLAQVPTATPAQVRQWLQEGAKDLGPAGFDNQFGHGRLNLFASLQRPLGPHKISLTIDRPDERLKRGQQRLATATVSRGNTPSAGVTVAFSSANTQLASVAPTTATTNNAGIAQTQVRGESRQQNTVDITAAAQGETDSKPVKVPAWPLWSLALAGAVGLITRRWRM